MVLNMFGVYCGILVLYFDVFEMFFVEFDLFVMVFWDDGEVEVSFGDDGDDRDDVDDIIEFVVEVGVGVLMNGDLWYVFDDFFEKWYVLSSWYYEYVVWMLDGDCDYWKMVEVVVWLVEKYYGEE